MRKLTNSDLGYGHGACRVDARQLDELAKIRLSKNFLLRDFLFCASAHAAGYANTPTNLDAVVKAGRELCTTVLEPIAAQFGRFGITYGYQSRESMDSDLRARGLPFLPTSSSPHHWDRGTYGNSVYARVDILPFCVEDGLVSKDVFGHWLMHNLNVDLLMDWTKSRVFCITIAPRPRRVWVRWGRPTFGEPQRTFLMGTYYWRCVYPTLPEDQRPKYAPSATGGSMRLGGSEP